MKRSCWSGISCATFALGNEADLKSENGSDLVEGFHGGVTHIALDLAKCLNTDAAVGGELRLSQLAHLLHPSHRFPQ